MLNLLESRTSFLHYAEPGESTIFNTTWEVPREGLFFLLIFFARTSFFFPREGLNESNSKNADETLRWWRSNLESRRYRILAIRWGISLIYLMNARPHVCVVNHLQTCDLRRTRRAPLATRWTRRRQIRLISPVCKTQSEHRGSLHVMRICTEGYFRYICDNPRSESHDRFAMEHFGSKTALGIAAICSTAKNKYARTSTKRHTNQPRWSRSILRDASLRFTDGHSDHCDIMVTNHYYVCGRRFFLGAHVLCSSFSLLWRARVQREIREKTKKKRKYYLPVRHSTRSRHLSSLFLSFFNVWSCMLESELRGGGKIHIAEAAQEDGHAGGFLANSTTLLIRRKSSKRKPPIPARDTIRIASGFSKEKDNAEIHYSRLSQRNSLEQRLC